MATRENHSQRKKSQQNWNVIGGSVDWKQIEPWQVINDVNLTRVEESYISGWHFTTEDELWNAILDVLQSVWYEKAHQLTIDDN